MIKAILLLFLLTGIAIAEEVTLKIVERSDPNGEGGIRYDIQSDGTLYHIYSKELFNEFIKAKRNDDAKTALVKEVIKAQLEANGVDKVIVDLKKGEKTYSVIKTTEVTAK